MKRKVGHTPSLWGFVRRFTLTHVVTYLVFGVTFLFVSGYFEHFAADELLSRIMRPADSPLVRAAILIQFIRGALLALVLYPFRPVIVRGKHGWLKLFGLLWVLTSIGSAIAGPGSIEGFIYTRFDPESTLIGLPEVTLQVLACSYFFYWWERNATSPVRKMSAPKTPGNI